MHEYSVMSQIVSLILAEAEKSSAEKVTRVKIEIGEYTFLGEEQLRFAFEVLTKDTIAQGAEIDVKRAKGTVECSCGYVGEPVQPEELHARFILMRRIMTRTCRTIILLTEWSSPRGRIYHKPILECGSRPCN